MNYLSIPFKFRLIKKKFKNQNFKILDVGCGNHSATITKKNFPNCEYHGIDSRRDYNVSNEDFLLMKKFYEIDLSILNFDEIPNNFFDVIMMAHIIEHLKNGDEVILALLPKLKRGGVIYIEYPSERSVNFPSKPETLNFYDDPTHVRIYAVEELKLLLQKNDLIVKEAGIRRSLSNILLMPAKIIYNKLKKGFVPGSVYWDLYGFAEFVYAIKK
jgi:SAM-dependent methyltransferase